MITKSFHGRRLSKTPIPALVTFSTDCGRTEQSAWFPSLGDAARWVIHELGRCPKLLYFVDSTKPLNTNLSNTISL